MSNSPMVSHVHLSPNKSSRQGNKITKITPHHMAGNLSIETCGNVFAPTARQASSNYGIGTDGRVGLYVDESERAWTSSNAANDRQAVTIEVANSSLGGDWPISEAAWNSLVDLCVDICRRNGITRLNFTGDSSGNLTMHEMFANTNCPGPYLKRRFQELANAVNAKLGSGAAIVTPAPNTQTPAASVSASSDFGGTYTVMCSELNVRSAPSISGSVVATYKKGQTVNLDDTYYINDGYVWGTYIGSSGNRRYIAVGKPTGGPAADDYLIKGGSVPIASAPTQSSGYTPGTYRCTGNGVRIRTAPSLSSNVVGSYNKGNTVNLQSFVQGDGHTWGQYIGASSGQKRYVAMDYFTKA